MFCSTDIYYYDIEKLKEELLSYPKYADIVVFAQSAVEKRFDLYDLFDDMNKRYKVTRIDTISPNFTEKDILYALNLIASKPDLIIALGGGSAIDLAKSVSILYGHVKNVSLESITESIENKSYKNNIPISVIAIPTTSGTSAEITHWATVWDYKGVMKYSIDDPKVSPKKALIVPSLTLTLPRAITISTSLDAMSHAVESYWAKATNPIVQNIALQSIRLTIKYLPLCLGDLSNLHYRSKLSEASVLAGLSFGQTRTTASHSISYPLTLSFNIQHGIAAIMTLGQVAKLNYDYINEPETLFELFKEYEGIDEFVQAMCRGVIPTRLREYGASEEYLLSIVERSFSKGRMDNNPRELLESDILAILKNIM